MGAVPPCPTALSSTAEQVHLRGTLATHTEARSVHRRECDRVGDSRADYSAKHRRHGVNVQVVTDPAGEVLWISPAFGRVNSMGVGARPGPRKTVPPLEHVSPL